MMKEDSKRRLLYRGRKFLGCIPGALSVYGAYWIVRNFFEQRIHREKSHNILAIFREGSSPTLEHITSQLCTGEQLIGKTFRYWSWQMQSPPRFSRKQWEFAYILETFRQLKGITPNAKAIGFGCGLEPIPAILAKNGVQVLATDLEASAAQIKGWVDTLQNSGTLENIQHHSRRIVSREIFQSHVKYRSVDMNNIPKDLGTFDLIWSSCALEHLGSLERGIQFIINSSKYLARDGVAVHTTEFNLSSEKETLNEPECCIFRRKDIFELDKRLSENGFKLKPVNFNSGSLDVDEYIDLPPFRMSPHLKLILAGYTVTSIGLIIRRAQ